MSPLALVSPTIVLNVCSSRKSNRSGSIVLLLHLGIAVKTISVFVTINNRKLQRQIGSRCAQSSWQSTRASLHQFNPNVTHMHWAELAKRSQDFEVTCLADFWRYRKEKRWRHHGTVACKGWVHDVMLLPIVGDGSRMSTKCPSTGTCKHVPAN